MEIFDKGIPTRQEVLAQYLQFLDATADWRPPIV